MPEQATGTSDMDDPLRLLGRLTAGIAHDLGNYLSALAAVVALMDSAGADPALVARAAELVDHAGRITRSLVGYARGEAPALAAPAAQIATGLQPKLAIAARFANRRKK